MITWVAGKLVGKAAPYVVLGMAGLLVIASGAWVVRGLQLDAALGNAAKAQADLSLAASANESNSATIAELQSKLSECVGEDERIELARQEMEKARQDLLDMQERELRKLRKTLEDRYAQDPNCVALDRMPVCRAVNDRLRTLAGPDRDG